jgi:putative aldouronate transport system substrate-binding protein
MSTLFARTCRLLVALLLFALLTACGAARTTQAPAPTSAPAAEPTAAPATAAPAAEPTTASVATDAPAQPTAVPAISAVEGKYDPPIIITTHRPYAVSLPNMTDEDNPVSKGLLEDLGIDLQVEWNLGGEEALQRLNLAISSSALPDVSHVSAVQFEQLLAADQIEDLTAVYEQYASPELKELMMADGGNSMRQVTRDGKMMAAFGPVPYVDLPPMLWIRADWLKKLNLQAPTTMADVLAISEAFATQDPDGNGQADTFGLGVQKLLLAGPYSLQGMFNGYGSYPGMWIKDASGNLVNGSVQPQTREALLQLQQLYAAGQIDPEFGTKDDPKVSESVSNNKLGITFGFMYTPFLLQPHKELVPEADWQPYPLVSANDQPARPGLTAALYDYVVVRKGFAHPEAVIKMMNRFVEVNTNIELYQKYLLQPDGVELNNLWPVQIFSPTKNVDVQRAVTAALNSGNPSTLNLEQAAKYESILKYRDGDNTQWFWSAIFAEPSSFATVGTYLDDNSLLYNEFTGAPTETMVQRGETLNTLQLEVFTRIIQGAPIEEFDQFVQDWLAGGGEQMTAEVNAWYANQ